MKVRILTGNQAGQIVDLPQVAAQSDISSGFAEAVKDEEPEEVEGEDVEEQDDLPAEPGAPLRPKAPKKRAKRK